MPKAISELEDDINVFAKRIFVATAICVLVVSNEQVARLICVPA